MDAWIDGGLPSSESFEVLAKAGLRGRIQALDIELKELAEKDAPRARTLARELEKLREEMDASRLVFTVTALAEDRNRELMEKMKEDGDQEAYTYQVLSEQLEPKITPEQIKRLATKIGPGYFAQTFLASSQRVQQGLGVTVPFSSTAFSILNT
jgi:hypothetical protein